MKRGFFQVGLAVAVLFLPVLAGADVKIGYIDLQRVMSASKQGIDSSQTLQKELDKKSRKVKDFSESLKKKGDDLEKQRSALSQPAFEKQRDDLMAEEDQLRMLAGKYQKEMQEKQEEHLQEIIEDVSKISKDLAEKEGFTLILEKRSGILYAPEKLDLTDRVIQIYDAQFAAQNAPAGDKKK